jgi:hypothetical protein
MPNDFRLSTKNLGALLIGWSTQTVQQGVPFGAVGLTYCDGEDARQDLIDTLDGNYRWWFKLPYTWFRRPKLNRYCCVSKSNKRQTMYSRIINRFKNFNL